jgi:hypothetical protein
MSTEKKTASADLASTFGGLRSQGSRVPPKGSTQTGEARPKGATYTASLLDHVRSECDKAGVSAKRKGQFISMIQEFNLEWRAANPTSNHTKKPYDGKMNFGRYKNKTISQVASIDPSYLRWCLQKQKQYLGEERIKDIQAQLKKIDEADFSDDE